MWIITLNVFTARLILYWQLWCYDTVQFLCVSVQVYQQVKILKGSTFGISCPAFSVRVFLNMCFCVCELTCLHIPGPPKACLISFTLKNPYDELANQHRLTSYILTWLPVSISGWMKPELLPSEDLLSPILPLPLFLFYLVLSVPLSAALCPGQVNLFHMTCKRGPPQRLIPKVEYHIRSKFIPLPYASIGVWSRLNQRKHVKPNICNTCWTATYVTSSIWLTNPSYVSCVSNT